MDGASVAEGTAVDDCVEEAEVVAVPLMSA